MGGPAVTIYTQVYNTEKYVEQCVESVLKQTFTDFEYILVDNGCTDHCGEILESFANRDRRIRLIRNEVNRTGFSFDLLREMAQGRWLAFLDSDDWWELNYLESLLGFLEQNHLDLAVCGTMNYFEATKSSRIMRKMDVPVVLSRQQFAERYPQLWTFPSTVWASIMCLDLLRRADFSDVFAARVSYGADTICMLRYMALCDRIGIDSTVLYHYRIRPHSVTYQYDSRRFDSNVFYYREILNFLETHHTFDSSKQEWLKRVHLTSMLSTLRLLKNAQVSEDKKIAECARIISHPLTAKVLTSSCEEQKQWFALMLEIVSQLLSNGKFSDAHSLRTVLELLSPHCCGVALSGNIKLLAREPDLRRALCQDDREQLACLTLNLIVQKRYTKQFHLGEVLCSVLPKGSPLFGISDTRFFREYAESCALIIKGLYSDALDQMTGLLFEGKDRYEVERFMDIYLSLAALENHAPAFAFGKLQLAKLYLQQGRQEECSAVITELAEMGLDNDELMALRRELETRP